MASTPSILFSCLELYPPGSDIMCFYKVAEKFSVQSQNWIALCKEIDYLKEPLKYFTWQWADVSRKPTKEVLFLAKHLPQASDDFFVFCYIDSKRKLIETSSRFKIFSPMDSSLEHIKVVEENSLLIVERYSEDQKASPQFENSEELSSQLSSEQPARKLSEQNSGDCKQQMVSETEKLKSYVILLEDENSHLKEKFSLEMQKSARTEQKCAQLSIQLQEFASQKKSSELAAQQKIQFLEALVESQKASIKMEDEADYKSDSKMSFLETENKQLKERLLTFNLQTESMESKLTKMEETVRMAREKKRNLEKAMVNERLQYEKTLRNLKKETLSSHPSVSAYSTDQEDEYQSASEELASSIPKNVPLADDSAHVPMHATSALSRLGIADEPSPDQTACPFCECPESQFPSNRAFQDHVNGHFDD